VVERSGQSLRSFYQHFEGKHELVLALFEEAVRATADRLAEAIAGEPDAGARLRRFTLEYHRLCRPAAGRPPGEAPTPAMGEFAQQLLTSHPQEAARAFAPLVSLLEGVLAEAAAAGVVRPEACRGASVGMILQWIMFDAFALAISGLPADAAASAERTWDLMLHGLQPAPG
jgi:AcrR family transcriptional regulator